MVVSLQIRKISYFEPFGIFQLNNYLSNKVSVNVPQSILLNQGILFALLQMFG